MQHRLETPNWSAWQVVLVVDKKLVTQGLIARVFRRGFKRHTQNAARTRSCVWPVHGQVDRTQTARVAQSVARQSQVGRAVDQRAVQIKQYRPDTVQPRTACHVRLNVWQRSCS